MKKKLRKLRLSAETLRVLTPPAMGHVAGALTAATDCFTCLGTCASECGSCGANCTHQPCPLSNARTCPCD